MLFNFNGLLISIAENKRWAQNHYIRNITQAAKGSFIKKFPDSFAGDPSAIESIKELAASLFDLIAASLGDMEKIKMLATAYKAMEESLLTECIAILSKPKVAKAAAKTTIDAAEDAWPTSFNHYQVLGIEPDDDFNTIKIAYRRAALKYHPDKAVEEKKKKQTPKSFIELKRPMTP